MRDGASPTMNFLLHCYRTNEQVYTISVRPSDSIHLIDAIQSNRSNPTPTDLEYCSLAIIYWTVPACSPFQQYLPARLLALHILLVHASLILNRSTINTFHVLANAYPLVQVVRFQRPSTTGAVRLRETA